MFSNYENVNTKSPFCSALIFFLFVITLPVMLFATATDSILERPVDSSGNKPPLNNRIEVSDIADSEPLPREQIDSSQSAPVKPIPIKRTEKRIEDRNRNEVSHERIDTKEYGSQVTMGVAIGGGGIIGIPLRIYLTEKTALELSAFFRPALVINYGEFYPGAMFTGGLDIYFNKRFLPFKDRIIMNGIFIKGGYGFCDFVNTTMIAAGWAYERFHKNNTRYSFSFELGPGIMINDRSTYIYNDQLIQPALYWKFHWGFALGRGFK
jgi:hypothetical protein